MNEKSLTFIYRNYAHNHGHHPVKNIMNPKRQAEKEEMLRLGFKSKKAYRKWQKAERCRLKGQNRINELCQKEE